MRQLLNTTVLFVAALITVQTAAGLMQRDAMRGHEVSPYFSPKTDSAHISMLPTPRWQATARRASAAENDALPVPLHGSPARAGTAKVAPAIVFAPRA